ncbi:MAG: fibronectin type III domain-containing protein [Lachnospiraceae bacterium]|nr:fibronectin type III domain-containing protein [Lachnospiraceae bacterium]
MGFSGSIRNGSIRHSKRKCTAGPAPAPQKKVKKPAKVTGLKKAKVTAVSAKISWKKAKNAKKYEISYKIGKKKWKKVSTKKTSYTLKKLTKNTTIQVKVRGVNGKKKGAFSKVLKFKTLKLYSVQ